MRNYCWTLCLDVPRCHRWFHGYKSDNSLGIAVCDESGDTPDETDDGVIWLNKKKPIIIELEDYFEYEKQDMFSQCSVIMHGLTPENKDVLIGGTNGKEAYLLNQFLNVPIEFIGVYELSR